jgi:hypothetical protein
LETGFEFLIERKLGLLCSSEYQIFVGRVEKPDQQVEFGRLAAGIDLRQKGDKETVEIFAAYSSSSLSRTLGEWVYILLGSIIDVPFVV